MNKGPPLPKNTILVAADIEGAYTNIPHEDGLFVLKDTLNERPNPNIPSDFITKLMQIILKYNIFKFDGEIYRQLIGTAMGSHPAPNYANIYLAERVDKLILILAEKYQARGCGNLIFLKRFLDDLFQIFVGTTKQIHHFFNDVNELHPTLKFTMNHTTPTNEKLEDRCDCDPSDSISFLDTSCSLENGKIILDLFKKETDRNQYLLPTSCHPMSCTKNIPYSLSLRIVRICTQEYKRDQRLEELKELLLNRNYSPALVDRAIGKAKKFPDIKLSKKSKENQKTKY